MTDRWLYEEGIGENRALLIENGVAVEARIERPVGVRVGAIADARLVEKWQHRDAGIAQLDDGETCLVQSLPRDVSEGASVRIETVREAMVERAGQTKRAVARLADSKAALSDGPDLYARIMASSRPVARVAAHGADLLEQFGWHEIIEQAATGRVEFPGGNLLIALTPAMTVIDVDGTLSPVALAQGAAAEVARTIRRLDLGGSIGIDFPTLATKQERTAVAASFDAAMLCPCERTAVNGFGFMQIILRRARPSLAEIIQADKLQSAALALLRQAERSPGTGTLTLTVHPAIAAILARHPDWTAALAKRAGRPLQVLPDGNIGLDAGVFA